MGRISSMFNGLIKPFSPRKKSSADLSPMEAMAKEAKKKNLIVRSCGNVNGSNNFASVCSKRGDKYINQDSVIVWEEFGCQEDMIFCGVFDGHGQYGHLVSKVVRESLPSSLFCDWQETVEESSNDKDFDFDSDIKLQKLDMWKKSYMKACAKVDKQLENNRRIDSYNSGTTGLTIVKQGDSMFIANVGDSRAVLATTSDDGKLVPVQLTVDFKPNLPEETERICECKGRVFALPDEPGVHRVWVAEKDAPGLAMSRAFGDYCLKDFGIISAPEVTQRDVTSKDQFVVLATDGVWDVLSNEEVIKIVSSTQDKAKAGKRLVKCARSAWNRKRSGIAVDDISAIVLFLNDSPSSKKL